MSITVLEATKLETFKNFRLIAGHRGLDNIVDKVAILDWEFDTKIEGRFIDEEFIKGDFVLSSLLFAKDKPELIIEMVKYLVDMQVSGLAIKNIYYNELSDKVINYANENSFPIFIFDNNVYFEDIITEVIDKIRFMDNYELLENKIDMLIKMDLSKNLIRDISLEINISFKECLLVLYYKPQKFIGDNKIISVIETLKKTKNLTLYDSILKYRNGILIISTFEKLQLKDFQGKVDSLIKKIGMNVSDYYIGVSNLHTNLSKLSIGINESIFAQKTGEVSQNNLNFFSDIGVYSILMPYINNIWLHKFYNSIIIPIKNYDEKYNTELFNTAIKYIENDGKINETANALYLHKNTIRYRISKIKELLNMNHCEGSFYEQLSIAIKLYKIYNS